MLSLLAVVEADVVLGPERQQQESRVRVGEVIRVPDNPEHDWVVSYSPRILTALTPTEKLARPGQDGWLFRVIAPGTTEIALESKAATCPSGALCPPNILRLIYPIHALPQNP